MKVKYLIVLSLLLVSCDDLDIIQKVELEHGLSCTPFNEIPNQQVQCFHNSMLRSIVQDILACYETAIDFFLRNIPNIWLSP